MLRFVVVLFALAIALLIPATVQAQVTLYSSFGPGYATQAFGEPIGFYIAPPDIPVTTVLADAFTVPGGPLTARYTLTQIDVGIGLLSNAAAPPFSTPAGNQPPFLFQVQLTADASNSPGTVLETWTVSSNTPGPQVFTVYDSIHLPLVAGHQYWVTVGSAGGPFANGLWSLAPVGMIGTFASNLDGGPYSIFPESTPTAFDVIGQPVNFVGPPFGLGYNQILHIVAGPITPAPGTPVEANIAFTDINGNLIGPSTVVTANPGEVASFDFPANNFIKPGQRIEVVPSVTPGPNPNGPPTSAIEVSAEVRDALLGLGTLLAPIPAFPPNPAFPPSSIAPALVTQGLAGGQTMRLTVQAFPPDPCFASVNFASSTGTLLASTPQVSLTPGTGMSFDLTSESVGLKLNQRMDVQPMVTITPPPLGAVALPGANSVCQATVEVFDQLTLRTETYQTAAVQ